MQVDAALERSFLEPRQTFGQKHFRKFRATAESMGTELDEPLRKVDVSKCCTFCETTRLNMVHLLGHSNAYKRRATAERLSAKRSHFTSNCNVFERSTILESAIADAPERRRHALFYHPDSLLEGEVHIGYASKAELMVEWEDDVGHFFIKNPEIGDEGEMRARS